MNSYVCAVATLLPQIPFLPLCGLPLVNVSSGHCLLRGRFGTGITSIGKHFLTFSNWIRYCLHDIRGLGIYHIQRFDILFSYWTSHHSGSSLRDSCWFLAKSLLIMDTKMYMECMNEFFMSPQCSYFLTIGWFSSSLILSYTLKRRHSHRGLFIYLFIWDGVLASLPLNLPQSFCTSLPSAGITGVTHHAWYRRLPEEKKC